MSVEFQHKLRPLIEYERWKATEFSQLLLYTGPVVLLGILPKELYDNFMLQSVAMSILLNPRICREMVDYTHSLTLLFVEHFGQLYGKDRISHNVHGTPQRRN